MNCVCECYFEKLDVCHFSSAIGLENNPLQFWENMHMNARFIKLNTPIYFLTEEGPCQGMDHLQFGI